MRIIEAETDLEEGRAHLAAVCPVWAATLPGLDLPLRRRSDGFAAILDAVIGQQISIAAAGAIMARLSEAGLTAPKAIRAAGEEGLRACGVSRPKIRYLLGIVAGEPDWQALRKAPDAEVIATLTALPGIGQWTAEIYLAFALGRSDAFPAGDLALQEIGAAALRSGRAPLAQGAAGTGRTLAPLARRRCPRALGPLPGGEGQGRGQVVRWGRAQAHTTAPGGCRVSRVQPRYFGRLGPNRICDAHIVPRRDFAEGIFDRPAGACAFLCLRRWRADHHRIEE